MPPARWAWRADGDRRGMVDSAGMAYAPAGNLAGAAVPEPQPGHLDSQEQYDEAMDEARAERKTLAIDIARMLLPAQIDHSPLTDPLLTSAAAAPPATRPARSPSGTRG